MTSQHTYTRMKAGLYVCNDCGASGHHPGAVQHFKICKPDESKRWQAYYDKAWEEEVEEQLNQLAPVELAALAYGQFNL